jgi:hypothetical protein
MLKLFLLFFVIENIYESAAVPTCTEVDEIDTAITAIISANNTYLPAMVRLGKISLLVNFR